MIRPIAALTILHLLTQLGLAKSTTPENLAWEKQIIASCLILEASNQGEEGLRAVASVIANRADRDSKPYIFIVKQPYAFTALNKASTDKTGKFGYDQLVRRASQDYNWSLALSIVDELYQNSLVDVTFGADHYSRKDELPSWSHGMRATTVIGDHLFFKR
ncbi:cell wall hydrolase [Pelagicoccus mobilis]|uniref:Cell wall hydrolase n=1 Tax=Pelagicoccus mobilis TaxID=415221 RepID=A0A934RZE1_9BACT|nr:cell wall hydrolase [Pelagicoccus mobilis]MBK1879431.1 cell wall hydrolase [Pelagicoccus mobilis]